MTKDGKMKEYYNKIQETEKLVDEYEIKKKIKNLEEEIKHQEDIIANNRDNTKTRRPIDEAEKKIEQLKKQIRGLKTMKITKDCMEILRLSGFQVNDACTKDITVKQYVKKLREESGSPISHESLARELKKAGWSKEEALQEVLREAVERVYGKDACEKVFTKGEAEDGELIGSIKNEYTEAQLKEASWTTWKYIINHPNKYTPNTVRLAEKLLQSGTKDGDIILPQHKCSDDDDATENGSIEEFGKNKEIEKMSPEKDPTLAEDASYPVKYKGYTIKKDFNGDLKVYDKAGAVLAQDFYSVEQAKKAIDKREEMINSRGAKDSDPKVAEANAIINLCGGVM